MCQLYSSRFDEMRSMRWLTSFDWKFSINAMLNDNSISIPLLNQTRDGHFWHLH